MMRQIDKMEMRAMAPTIAPAIVPLFDSLELELRTGPPTVDEDGEASEGDWVGDEGEDDDDGMETTQEVSVPFRTSNTADCALRMGTPLEYMRPSTM
jgi:hypothetical protein